MGTTLHSEMFFGRAWHVSVTAADGNDYVISNHQTDQTLRVTFSIDTYMLLAYWMATVTIYNMNPSTSAQLVKGSPTPEAFWKLNQTLKLGNRVRLSAGYKVGAAGEFSPSANVLFSGRVFQPVWTREQVVDYTLALRCVTGLTEDAMNFASFPLGSKSTDYDTLDRICSETKIPLDIDSDAQAKLKKQEYYRGQVVHGRPYECVRDIVRQNSLFAWMGPGGLTVRSFDLSKSPSLLQNPKAAYGPPATSAIPTGTRNTVVKRTMIGTPRQTQNGVAFRVLLDSSVTIGDVVQVTPDTLIVPYQFQFGTELPPLPNRDGVYIVVGVRHVGDTRGHGDDWYTEITGATPLFFDNFLRSRDQNQNGN